jgi:hypothetical protein
MLGSKQLRCALQLDCQRLLMTPVLKLMHSTVRQA